MKGRRIFVGDIQGCRSELESLLERVEYRVGIDQLHPVGDLVNRGPDSLGCLRLLKSLGAGGVLGNHDLHLLRTARGLRRVGRRDTLDAVLDAHDRDELLAWLSELPLLRVWPDLLLVHAGLHPDWSDPERVLSGLDPLAPHPAVDFATRVRYCDASGERPERDWPPPGPPFHPWYELWEQRGDRRRVVFGHWARKGLVQRPAVLGLDSGCVWGKELTAWVAEEDRLLSVPAEREWASVEPG